MSTPLMQQVETKLDELIRLCDRLQSENTTLRAKEAGWEQERKRLIEKNDIARKRVEAMIHHLKALESES